MPLIHVELFSLYNKKPEQRALVKDRIFKHFDIRQMDRRASNFVAFVRYVTVILYFAFKYEILHF